MQVGTNVWVKNTNVDIFNNDQWIASTVKAMVRKHTVEMLDMVRLTFICCFVSILVLVARLR